MKIFLARVLFVYDASRYEALLTLDFGVFVKKTLRLKDADDLPRGHVGDPREVERFRAAKRVAMDLALGKKCFVEAEESRKHVWANIYVCGSLDESVEHREFDGERCFNLLSAVRAAGNNKYRVESIGFVRDNG